MEDVLMPEAAEEVEPEAANKSDVAGYVSIAIIVALCLIAALAAIIRHKKNKH